MYFYKYFTYVHHLECKSSSITTTNYQSFQHITYKLYTHTRRSSTVYSSTYMFSRLTSSFWSYRTVAEWMREYLIAGKQIIRVLHSHIHTSAICPISISVSIYRIKSYRIESNHFSSLPYLLTFQILVFHSSATIKYHSPGKKKKKKIKCKKSFTRR